MDHARHVGVLLHVLRHSAREEGQESCEENKKQTAGSRVLVTRYTAWPSLTTDQKCTRTRTTFARYNDGRALIPSLTQHTKSTRTKKNTTLAFV